MHALRSRATAALGLAVICLGQLLVAPTVLAADQETYIVLYKQEAVAGDAKTRIERAGGTFVASYPQIGVVIARSNSATFRSKLMADNRIDGVAATTKFGSKVSPVEVAADEGGGTGDLPNAPATDADTLSVLQWDMKQIHTPEAHAITGGSQVVVVGDIDTGLDWNHPDLAANIDFSRSVSCEFGVPDQTPAAWDDHNGHGTHTAGTIAAASNGFGIVGVAPNVKIAGIKGSNDDGFFFPEMVICSFMWAGGGGFTVPGGPIPATDGPRVDVTNNSYFADPWLYNCRNDEVQHAIWKAEQRAIKFAIKNGVTVIASQGNDQDDRAHPTVDLISPDFPPGSEQERRITNACVVIPLEIAGVVGVTATGDTRQVDKDDDPDDYLKSYYSAYGVGVADLTAPGGDFFYGRGGTNPLNPFGLVLSTWPAEIGCGRGIQDQPPGAPGPAFYCYLQGTSMAGPHVAGVAALIISQYGDLKNPKNGKMSPGSVASHLQQTAASQPCPTELPLVGAPLSSRANIPYANSVRPDGSLQECQGGPGHTGWYGSGRVDALRAVLHDTGN